MENRTTVIAQLIAESYINYRNQIYLYLAYKVDNKQDAEDLSQDVFLHLMEYEKMLRADTIKTFIYTIARNLLYDYLRRYYKKQEINAYIYNHQERSTNDVDSNVLVGDLLVCESKGMALLPLQRKKIYAMTRFENKSISDISIELNLSQRTVENHLLISRKEVRDYMKKYI
ncbi:sigma-70 family RNA polymerase sigma factor [Bacteroides finegoldii]|uniref:sigma-70 family RNA polymerase sigma factor n=1 Tax=Bacteroides finegoldii TaxID=338188 RepID=UPI00189D4F66|nr:sigma-70 family RNA polymerase sigma factor [Bacteroides finegoldii]